MFMEGHNPFLSQGLMGRLLMITWVLMHAGYDPSYAVGGIMINTSKNGGHGY